MTRQAAKAFYDVQAGDPATGYITPADAQAALDVVYDDMAAVSVARITGSPEGVRAGNPGDVVIQTDATTDIKGFIRWIKTGTGTTGWQAGPEADTGWRNVLALMETAPGIQWAYARLRRVHNTITVHFGHVELPSANPDTALLLALPAGFRAASFEIPIPGFDTFTRASGKGAYILNAAEVRAAYWQASERHVVSGAHVTDEPWPATLPGSAVALSNP